MSSITPYNFEGANIRAVEIDGMPWFVGKDVADALGYADSTTAMRSHCRGVQKLHPVRDSRGRVQETRILSEPDVLRLIVNSTLPAADRFERWVFEDVLPSIRRTGSYSAAHHVEPAALLRDQVDAGILLLRAAAEDLKFAPSALLGGYQKLEHHVGVVGLLPAYAVDAPTLAAGSSEPTKSLAELLKDFGVGVSAQAFNKLLVQRGMLQEQERKSSRGSGVKKFKVCTALEFGKNLTSPSNPRETQPHWYVSKFADLLELVLPAKLGTA